MKQNQIASFIFLGAICVLCAVFVLRHCFLMEQRFDRLGRICAVKTQSGSPPPAGILHPIASDGYLWIRLAQDMIKEGEWRLKYTRFDNAPYGRDVHWHSGFAWWLLSLGWIYHIIHGTPIDSAIERAAVWANSIILVFCILLLPLLVFRRFGVRAAAVFALGMIACSDFYENFIPAYPDHHGVIALSALCSILFLLMAGAGWIRSETRGYSGRLFSTNKKETHFFIYCAAFFGAAGLWISAVSQILLIAGIVLGIVISVIIFNKRACKEGLQYDPDTWALWGRSGAIFSLLFYVLEYFPDKIGMQLLANHPLYALIWLGCGESLGVLTKILHEHRRPVKVEIYRLLAACVLILLYPAVIVFGNPAWWSLRDPFMIALHKDILEFEPILSRLRDGSINVWGWLWSQLFFLLPGIVLLFFRTVPAAYRALILFTLTPALLFTVLSFYQTRWSIHCGAVFVVLLPVVIFVVLDRISQSGSKGNKTAWFVFCVVIVICALSPLTIVTRAQNLASPVKRMMLSLGETGDLLTRDIAFTLKNRGLDKNIAVLSSPNTTLRICYFGRFSGIGTLYWENLAGLKAAAELFSANDDSIALNLIRKRGINYIVFVDAPGAMSSYIENYFNLFNMGNKNSTIERSFAFKAFYKKEFPPWIRPIPYPENTLTKLLRADVLLLEVVDGQEMLTTVKLRD